MELVFLNESEPKTTTLAIADGTEIKHKAVIQLVRTYRGDLEEFGQLPFEMGVVSSHGAGQKTEYAILNEPQATLLLTYMRNSPVVRQFKKNLVKAFFAMREQLLDQRQETKRVDMNYNRQTSAPMGLDVKYNLDLTKIVMNPSTVGVSLLERLTGIDMTDVHDIINETNHSSYDSADKGDAELIAAYLYAVLNTSGVSEVKIDKDEDGCTYMIATTTGMLNAMKQAGTEKHLPPMTFSAAKFGQQMHQRKAEIAHMGWKRELERSVSGKRYYRYTCLIAA